MRSRESSSWREQRGQFSGNPGRNQRRDVATVLGDLPNETAADGHQRWLTRQIDGAHTADCVVGVRHLLLDFEVAAGSQPLDDERGFHLLDSIDGEALECHHLHRRKVRDTGSDHLLALFEREHAAGLARVVHHTDDDLAEQRHRLLDDVDVAQVQRIETSGIENGRHGGHTLAVHTALVSSSVTQARP